MKDRPILFGAPMVRAILAGTKTQTRRALKAQPVCDDRFAGGWKLTGKAGREASLVSPLIGELCPYGRPGDRLWVRESWSPDPVADGTWAYTAWAGCRDGQIAGVPERFRHPRFCNYAADWLHGAIRWTPSIHMPRWASRIVLEIVSVRVERLQKISEADALAEGIVQLHDGGYGLPAGEHYHSADPRQSYLGLWEEINGPGSVEADPWVWVVEFKRVEQPLKPIPSASTSR